MKNRIKKITDGFLWYAKVRNLLVIARFKDGDFDGWDLFPAEELSGEQIEWRDGK